MRPVARAQPAASAGCSAWISAFATEIAVATSVDLTIASMTNPGPFLDERSMVAAVAALRRGEAVGLPTETVYGLAADARNGDAVARVFALKGRPPDHPLIVHLPAVAAIEGWAIEIPEAALRLADRFWPGPLTLVLRRHPSVLDAVTGGQPTIAVRVPAHPLTQTVLRAFGGGLVAPSANRFGHVSPTTAAHVRAEFGDSLPLVLDGGACTIGIESSIVDLSGAAPRLLRPGMLTAGAIEAALGAALGRGIASDSPRVSGSLESHYAPRTPTIWVEQVADARAYSHLVSDETSPTIAHLAMLGLDNLPAGMAGIALPSDPVAYARGLYAALRALDDGGFDAILIAAPPDTEAWLAIRDRLRRACAR